MIEYRRGDILKSGADVLVNPCNCVGVSGKGLAKAFKAWAPDAVAGYEHKAKQLLRSVEAMRPGDVWAILTWAPLERGECSQAPMVLFAATKYDWRDPSQIGWVRTALRNIVNCVRESREWNRDWPKSIAVPALGCGCGKLAWVDVRPLIHDAAEKMSAAGVDVYVYEPVE